MPQLARIGELMRAAVSGVSIPTGGLKTLTVADSTKIDPVALADNTIADAAGIGIDGNGWVAILVLKGLTSLVGTCDPTQFSMVVSDPGYDTSGNATTVTRTITGVAQLRRQYPNGGSKKISTDGTDLTIYITLDDWVYSGTSIVSYSMGATFYTNAVASTTGAATTNSSTLAYTKPLFGWINPQNDLSTSTLAVEALAFHRHAKSGQMVACIKFQASDGTNSGTVSTVSVPTLSTKITKGFIPEVWAASVDASTLTQAAVCTVNATVYPWLGDSTAVLTLSTDGTAWPTSLPITRLRFVCDRTGGYSGGFAYVDGTGAGSPAVSSNAVTAKANPFATITAAIAAMKAWNNTNKGHNDLGGGVIRLMDNAGGAKTHTISLDGDSTFGATWLNIEKDPASSATVSVVLGAQKQMPQMTRWRNLTLLSPAAVSYCLLGYNENRSMVCLDNMVVDNTNAQTVIAWYDVKYLYNLTLTGGQSIDFMGLSGAAPSTPNIAIMAGIDNSASPTSLPNTASQAKIMVGCYLPQFGAFVDQKTAGDGDHGRILYNNRLRKADFATASVNTVSYGLANVQNLYESYSGSGVSMNFFADGDLTTITNYVEFHNTSVGERANRLYNDTASSNLSPSGIKKIGSSKYCIWDDYNIKADTFNTGAGSVGPMAYTYSVGNAGNVSLFGTVGRLNTDLPHNDNTDTPYMGNAWLTTSQPNLGRVSLGFSQAQIMAMFTNYTVAPQGAPAAGGTYTPITSATHLKSRVPSGKSVLLKDLGGATRKTDGTGAAGAYEYV